MLNLAYFILKLLCVMFIYKERQEHLLVTKASTCRFLDDLCRHDWTECWLLLGTYFLDLIYFMSTL